MDQHPIPQVVAQLLDHPHIQQLHSHQSQPSTYILTYSPTTTQSPYKNQTYHLQLYMPDEYPQTGPTLKFLQQIYHLNIGYYSGEVRMPVLEDDWSTFLTLTAVIQSLDRVLEYPEEEYAVEEDVLELWMNDKNKYYQKVVQNVKLCKVVLCESAERRYEPSNDSPIKAMQTKKQQDISQKLIKNLRQSMQFIDLQQVEYSKEKQQLGSDQNIFPQMIKAESRQSLKNGNRQNTARHKNKMVMQNHNEIRDTPMSLGHGRNTKTTGAKMVQGDGAQSGQNRTLKSISETMGIFIEQMDYIEQQMQVAKSKAVLQLLKQKHETQIQLLKQLLQLSQQAKRKVINKFREQVSKM